MDINMLMDEWRVAPVPVLVLVGSPLARSRRQKRTDRRIDKYEERKGNTNKRG
jgi:hypothetical protein